MPPPPCVTPGTPLNACARRVHAQEIEGRYDFTGPDWGKWKLRGQYLIGPGGLRFTARTLRAAWDGWVKKQESKGGRAGGHGPPANDTERTPAERPPQHALRSSASALVTLRQEPHE